MTDMQQLMASVGSVMLHWCHLEDALTDTIRQLRIVSEGSANLIRVRGNFSDRLSEWRGLLSQKTRRNPEWKSPPNFPPPRRLSEPYQSTSRRRCLDYRWQNASEIESSGEKQSKED